MQKIIFLDIDGPIINTPCYYLDPMASMERSIMNTQALGYVARIARLADALIVTNSTHNTADCNGKDLKQDLVKWGIKEELFHMSWHTNYPFPDVSIYDPNEVVLQHRRLLAINQWMKTNGQVDWICFDDCDFTTDPRLILVDFETGVDYSAYKAALKFWNINDPAFTIY